MRLLDRLLVRGLALVCRRFRNLPGRWRLVRWLQPRVHAAFAKRGHSCRITLNHGHVIDADLRDFGDRQLYISGCYEEATSQLFGKLLRRGDAVLDIGANLGYFSLLAARHVGRDGVVHAFEAASGARERLSRNITLNSLRNVFVQPVAVLDRCADVTFSIAAEGHSGISSLRSLKDRSAGQVTVPGISIDSMLATLPRIRLVKLDIEGAEMLALRGMTELIERDRPFIILELTDDYLRDLGDTAEDVMQFFESVDYGVLEITFDRLRRIDSSPTHQCNVLALPKQRELIEPCPAIYNDSTEVAQPHQQR